MLEKNWGFKCSCSLCSSSSEFSSESDARISQILELNEHLHTQAVKTDPVVPVSLISLYEQERLFSWLSSAYVYCALAFSGMGEKWSSIKYARLAVEMGLLDNGWMDDDVAEMRKLASEPMEHWSWKKSVGSVLLVP